MEKKRNNVLIGTGILVLAIGVLLIGCAEATTEIDDCAVLSVDGEMYLLNQSISNSGTTKCIEITADNITFDGQWYTIDGDDVIDYGVYMHSRTNVTVKNFTLTDWDNRGIWIWESTYCNVEDVIISSCLAESGAVSIWQADYNAVSNVTFEDNTRSLYIYQSAHNDIMGVTIASDGGEIKILGTDQPAPAGNEYNIINNSVINSSIYIDSSTGNTIYNNILNISNGYTIGGNNYDNTLSVSKQVGNNIYNATNPYIGGNYWTNATGTGYSDTCADVDNDGFCDNSYTPAAGNIDALPISDEFEYVEHSPKINIISPNGTYSKDNPTIEIEFKEEIKDFKYSIDGVDNYLAEYPNGFEHNGTHHHISICPPLTNGEHYFKVEAQNLSDFWYANSTEFTIADVSAPDLNIVTPSGGVLPWGVVDIHLTSNNSYWVKYSINGGANQSLDYVQDQWYTYGKDEYRRSEVEYSRVPTTNDILWSIYTSESADEYQGSTVVGDTLYIGTKGDKVVSAINITTGRIKWQEGASGSYPIDGNVLYEDGIVYYCGQYTRARNAVTGAVVWTSAEMSAGTTPAIHGDHLYYVGWIGANLYCLNKTTGVEIWHANFAGSGSPYAAVPTVYEYEGTEYVFFHQAKNIGGTKRFYAFNGANGDELWNITTAGGWDGAPSISKKYPNVVHSADIDKVYAVDIPTGNIVWSYDDNSNHYTIITPREDYLYYGLCTDAAGTGKYVKIPVDSPSSYTTLDSETGELYATMAMNDTHAIGGYKQGNKVVCVDLTAGSRLWEYDVGGYVYGQSALVNDIAYIHTDTAMYAFGIEPRYHYTKTLYVSGSATTLTIYAKDINGNTVSTSISTTGDAPAVISGFVLNPYSGAGVAKACVVIEALGLHGYTNATGYYEFSGGSFGVGNYELHTCIATYECNTTTVTVPTDGYINITLSHSREKATSSDKVEKLDESAFQSLMDSFGVRTWEGQYGDNGSDYTWGEDECCEQSNKTIGLFDFELFAISISMPYTMIAGNIFFVFIIGLPFLMYWLRQESSVVPSAIAIILGAVILAFLPPEFHLLAVVAIALTVTGGLYVLLKERS